MIRNKLDAVAPIFARGPAMEPEAELLAWVAKQPKRATFKLPFTIWRGPLGGAKCAALSLHQTPPASTLRLDDSALGVSLHDRLCSLFDASRERVALWLSGRFGTLLGDDPHTFAVLAVHEAVAEDAQPYQLRAEVARSGDCLAIRALKRGHCARGPARCEKCRDAELEPATPKLLDVCPYGDYARPTIGITRAGKLEWRAYDVLRTFVDEPEARDFAEKHAIDDLELAPAAE